MARHITEYSADKKRPKAEIDKPETWMETIIRLKRIGCKDREVAISLGIKPSQLQDLYRHDIVRELADRAEAEFIISRREILHDIVTDTEMNPAVRAKGAREDLRETQEQATAGVPSFEGYQFKIVTKESKQAESEADDEE